MPSSKAFHGAAKSFYGLLTSIFSKGQSGLLLLIRLYIGYQCVVAGSAHLANFHNTIDFFRSLHIPAPAVNVVVSAFTEVIGGLLLLMGAASRIVSILLTGNFVVAIIAPDLADSDSHHKLLHFWNYQNLIIKDDAFIFLVAAILILILGPGWYSIDGELVSGRGNAIKKFAPHTLLFLGTIFMALAAGVPRDLFNDAIEHYFAITAAGLIGVSLLIFLITRPGSIAAPGPKP